MSSWIAPPAAEPPSLSLSFSSSRPSTQASCELAPASTKTPSFAATPLELWSSASVTSPSEVQVKHPSSKNSPAPFSKPAAASPSSVAVTNRYPNPFLLASRTNFSPAALRLLPALSPTENQFSSIPLSPVTSPSCSPATSQASPSSSTPTASNPPATPSDTTKPTPSYSTTASSTYASAIASIFS